ncbi:PucR family transcriptional regulator [Nocardioides insulae]|uniref:PucR family transcriptional regulator n=1 Tax=Nocardioides insulae TaxID=394734 RepID=UPI00146BC0DC|nr:helix-turn-helix domain-containing protein [Nocardioides insulae]
MSQRAVSSTGEARRVADSSWQHLDEHAHHAARAIWREVSDYRERADLQLFAEVEAHCRQVFGVYVTTVREGRPPERRDFPWTPRHARRRAELGIGLSDFLQAFRVGQMTLWDGLRARSEAGEIGADTVLELVGPMLRTVEVGSTVAAETYLEAQQYQLADAARLARDLLEDLLAGHPPTVRERQQALRAAGLGEESRLILVVATLPDLDGEAPELRRRVRQALTGPDLGLIVSRHDEAVALLPVPPAGVGRLLDSVRSVVTSLLGSGIEARVGVSSVHAGWEAIPAAYDEARLARQSLACPGLRAMTELSTLDLLVTGQHGLARMIPPEVRGFVEEDLAAGGILVDTLAAYVENDLNARLTAVHLNHHVNTIYYRLGRIAEHTGRDVRSAPDLIDLLLAVRLLRADP